MPLVGGDLEKVLTAELVLSAVEAAAFFVPLIFTKREHARVQYFLAAMTGFSLLVSTYSLLWGQLSYDRDDHGNARRVSYGRWFGVMAALLFYGLSVADFAATCISGYLAAFFNAIIAPGMFLAATLSEDNATRAGYITFGVVAYGTTLVIFGVAKQRRDFYSWLATFSLWAAGVAVLVTFIIGHAMHEKISLPTESLIYLIVHFLLFFIMNWVLCKFKIPISYCFDKKKNDDVESVTASKPLTTGAASSACYMPTSVTEQGLVY